MSYPLVAKEQIPSQLLKQEEVLSSSEERKNRSEQLQRAVQLNRLYYSKANIIFDTVDATFEVMANIWEVTDKNVLMKGGITLPVCCIREVRVDNFHNESSPASSN